jgi:hypothetical protein
MLNRMILTGLLPLLSAVAGCSSLDARDAAIPDPTIVSYTAIRRPFDTNTYFAYSFEDGKALLTTLAESGFTIEEAYVATGTWGCTLRVPTYTQMIVRLAAPDNRIVGYGLTQDGTRLQIDGDLAGCVPEWEHYDF